MDLGQYLGILERRKWVVILTALTVLVVVLVGSSLQKPVYAATSTVRVAQAVRGSLEYADYLYAERLMNTYREILRSRPFLQEVVTRLGLQVSPEQLAKQIKVDVVLNTELIKVTAEDRSPIQAALIANTLASLLAEQSQQVYFGGSKSTQEILQEQMSLIESRLEQNRASLQKLQSGPSPDQQAIDDLGARVRSEEEAYANLLREQEEARVTEAARASSVTITEPAIRPSQPSSPRMALNAVLGLLVGLVAGAGLAFLFESLDPTVHSASHLETIAKAPILASLPESRGGERGLGWSIAGKEPGHSSATGYSPWSRSPVGEAYSILRTAIWSSAGVRGEQAAPRSLLITSAEPGAGKSTVIVNLAASLSEAGRTVILVDGDLRRPTLSSVFGARDGVGLGEFLQDPSKLDEAIRQTTMPGVSLLPTGRLPMGNPARLLGSTNLQQAIQQLSSKADVVLVDSPPVLTVADTTILASKVDGVLLVASRDRTTATRVQRALLQLGGAGAHVLGLAFNRARARDTDYYYTYVDRERHPATTRLRRAGLLTAAALLVTVLLVAGGLYASALIWPAARAEVSRLPVLRWLLPVASPSQIAGVSTPTSGSPTVYAAPSGNAATRGLTPAEAPTKASTGSSRPTSPSGYAAGATGTATSATSALEPAASRQTSDTGRTASPEARTTGLVSTANPSVTRTPQGTAASIAQPTQTGVAGGRPTPTPTAVAATRTPTPRPTATLRPTASPTPGGMASIVSDASGRSGGTFLLKNPYQSASGLIWLPVGAVITVLDDRVYGPVSYGSNLWFLVRYTSGGKTYVGYVPSAIVSR